MQVPSGDADRSRVERLLARMLVRQQDARSVHRVILTFAALVVSLRLLLYLLLAGGHALGLITDTSYASVGFLINGGLSVAIDIALVAVIVVVMNNARRIEAESERISIFMDSVYRRMG